MMRSWDRKLSMLVTVLLLLVACKAEKMKVTELKVIPDEAYA